MWLVSDHKFFWKFTQQETLLSTTHWRLEAGFDFADSQVKFSVSLMEALSSPVIVTSYAKEINAINGWMIITDYLSLICPTPIPQSRDAIASKNIHDNTYFEILNFLTFGGNRTLSSKLSDNGVPKYGFLASHLNWI